MIDEIEWPPMGEAEFSQVADRSVLYSSFKVSPFTLGCKVQDIMVVYRWIKCKRVLKATFPTERSIYIPTKEGSRHFCVNLEYLREFEGDTYVRVQCMKNDRVYVPGNSSRIVEVHARDIKKLTVESVV